MPMEKPSNRALSTCKIKKTIFYLYLNFTAFFMMLNLAEVIFCDFRKRKDNKLINIDLIYNKNIKKSAYIYIYIYSIVFKNKLK